MGYSSARVLSDALLNDVRQHACMPSYLAVLPSPVNTSGDEDESVGKGLARPVREVYTTLATGVVLQREMDWNMTCE